MLNTKLSAVLTRSAKGDLATKIRNFKDENSKKGIQVRGRRVLLMFEDYFKTSEEAGSLYRVEDLLGVVRTGDSVDDLKSFLNQWDATIAGMETPPNDLVLRDILLRQIRKCHLMKYDIEAFDRAFEHPKSQNGSPMHFCLNTLGIFLTESDSDQTETGWLRRTSKALTNLSPLRPLRGAILVAKVVEGSRQGLQQHLGKVFTRCSFRVQLLNKGENEYDCERYDLLRHGHLPKVEGTRAQVQLGVSEQSRLEHTATRLVYLDAHDQKDVPDRFHYIGQSWLFMYRTEIYS